MTARVELLYFSECPNHDRAEALVRAVAASEGLELDLERIEVVDDGAAQKLRFLGSPTLRVEGRDVEAGADARAGFHRSCRLYRTRDGVHGLPDERDIRRSLRGDAR